jgi:hypothetical protein
VSVLLRKELRITLCPGHVALLASAQRLTRRGLQDELCGQQRVPVMAAGEAGQALVRRQYDAVLQALDACLPAYSAGKFAATVILSNHFLRYVLVPWSDSLGDDAEQLAYARHRFTEVYGETARHWEIRLSPGVEGEAQLASAVDQRLLNSLRQILARHAIRLASIQPHLMAAWNGVYPMLRRRTAWLAVVEPGKLCLGLLRQGSWQHLRSLRISSTWPAEMPRILEREACLLGAAENPREVLLIAPDAGPLHFPSTADREFHRLRPAPRRTGLPADEWGFASALQGAN